MSAILLVETLPRLIVQQAKRSNDCVINNNRRAFVDMRCRVGENGSVAVRLGA